MTSSWIKYVAFASIAVGVSIAGNAEASDQSKIADPVPNAHPWALGGNPQFYGINWTTGGDTSCQSTFLQCFKNGYCGRFKKLSDKDFYDLDLAYSLESDNEFGEQVTFKSMNELLISPMKIGHPRNLKKLSKLEHPIFKLFLPSKPLFPALVSFSHLTLELHEGDETRTDGLLISETIVSSDSSYREFEAGEDKTFNACSEPKRLVHRQIGKHAQMRYEIALMLADIAANSEHIQNELYDFASGILYDANQNLSWNEKPVPEAKVLQFVQNYCKACPRYKNMHGQFNEAIKHIQDGRLSYKSIRSIHKAIANYHERHQSALDQLIQFRSGKYDDFIRAAKLIAN